MRQCPRCGEFKGQLRNGKNPSGTPRRKCKNCGKLYTLIEASNQYPLPFDLAAMWLSHVFTYREVAQLLGVAPQTVINAVKRHEHGFHLTPDVIEGLRRWIPKPFKHLVGGRAWYADLLYHFPNLKQNHQFTLGQRSSAKSLKEFHFYVSLKNKTESTLTTPISELD